MAATRGMAMIVVLAGLVLGTAAIGARASEPAAAPAAPTAGSVLQGLSAFMAQRQTYAVTVVSSMNVNLPQAKQNAVTTHELVVAAPNRMTVRQTQGAEMGGQIVSDGQSLYVSMPMLNRYTKSAAPASVADLWSETSPGVNERLLAVSQLAVIHMILMSPARVEQMLEEADGGKYMGLEQVGGKDCHRLQLKQANGQAGVSLDLWIEAGPQPTLRRVVPDMSVLLEQMAKENGKAGTMEAKDMRFDVQYDLGNWRLDQPIADDTFAFVPPKESELVESLLARPKNRNQPHQVELKLGDAAPPTKLKTIDGQMYDLASDPSRVVVLDFWATWCGPCRMGLPGLQRLHEWAAQNKKPVAIYAVNLRETPQQVQEFWKQEKLTMPVLMDDGSLAKAYGVSGIPHTVVIVDGKVMDVKVGYAAGHENVLQRKIEAALAKPAP